MRRILLPFAIVLAGASGASAQLVGPPGTIPDPPGPDAPAFEVASVKPAAPPGPDRTISYGVQPNGRFRATGMPLFALIQQAYSTRTYQLIGLPAWANDVAFDIAAMGPAGTERAQMAPMLRRLLADRFKLAAHVETRELPVYVLTVEREDGRLGSALTRSTEDCETILAARRKQAADSPARTVFVEPTPGERPVCSTRSSVKSGDGTFTIEMVGSGQPWESIVNTISSAANRHVIDRTGLTGRFDYGLHYSPLRDQGRLFASPPAATPLPNVDGGISIVEGVKNMGLRLTAERGPVQVLVIDRIERPTPD
jgi:uncharacterized protein (TIGR03435 family)